LTVADKGLRKGKFDDGVTENQHAELDNSGEQTRRRPHLPLRDEAALNQVVISFAARHALWSSARPVFRRVLGEEQLARQKEPCDATWERGPLFVAGQW
jgi:hypothetical protein